MSVMQLLDSARQLEHEQLVAIADAVLDSRGAQSDEVAALRRHALNALMEDGRLLVDYGQVQRGLTGLGLVGDVWPQAEACEAFGDALLAMLAPASITGQERAVLAWPWVSVCGPLPDVA